MPHDCPPHVGMSTGAARPSLAGFQDAVNRRPADGEPFAISAVPTTWISSRRFAPRFPEYHCRQQTPPSSRGASPLMLSLCTSRLAQ